jgi:alanyl-tRNA synthetase
MASERRYYDDAYTTRFEARVAALGTHAGRPAVELEHTYFYPESGGQEADRGTLGGAPVLDVQADDDGRVWHVVGDAPPADGTLAAEVDWARRFDHMQQHTGQHVLSAALEHVLNAPTLSSHLGSDRSTIELGLSALGWDAIARVEEAANRIVWEDRAIERHWVENAADLARFRLRKPPAVTGRIRIVEIPDWDVSACGGTHTRRTGEVGAIKVVRWEKVRGNVRLEFLCGARALHDHAWRTEALVEAARRRTLKDRELIPQLERAAVERDALARRVTQLSERLLAGEAREAVGDPPRGVAVLAPERPRDEVRRFAILCLAAGAPWVVSAASAPEPVVIVGRAKALALDLKTIVPALLERARGKGGGSPDLVQASAADAAAAETAFRWAAGEIPGRVAVAP